MMNKSFEVLGVFEFLIIKFGLMGFYFAFWGFGVLGFWASKTPIKQQI